MVMRCIAFHYLSLQRTDSDPSGGNYRVFFHRIGEDDKISRPSFEYFYDPDASTDISSAENYVEEDPRDSMIQYQQSLLDKLFLRLDEAHQHIISLANQNGAALKPLTEMTDYMGRAWLAGSAMQQQALGILFDHKRAEAEARADAEMAKEYLTSLRGFGREVARQFGKYVNKKMGGGSESEDAEPNWDGSSAQSEDDDDTPSSGSASAASSPGSGKDPLADYVGALADSISPRQWGKIADTFSKRERNALTTLLEAKTDAGAIEAYEVLENTVDLQKLLAFREVLDGNQQEAVDKLGTIVEKARAGWKG
jgi:hypothetical protein